MARQKAAIKQAEAAWAGAKARLAQAVAAKDQAESKAAQTQQQIEIQKANLAQAQAQFDLAEATVKRYESLLKEGFVSQQDYDQSAAAYKSASSTVKAAKANVKAAEADARASSQAIIASESAVRAATSDAEAAKANIEASKATFASVSATVSAAKATVRANDQTISANRAAVQSNVANARRYDVLKSFQRIVAPFDGVITSRNIDLGSLVSPGTLATVNSSTTTPSGGLFGIARVDTLKILINVPQTDFRAIGQDTLAKITIREFPGQVFSGKIARSSGALDASSRTLPVEIHLDNKDHKILPGMFAQVSIAVADQKDILRVPAGVLIFGAEGTSVFVVDEQNKIHLKKVTLGRDFGTELEASGVGPKDRLIMNPSDDLRDGQTVQVSKKPAKEEKK